MYVFLDTETIPEENRQRHIDKALAEMKIPDITKEKAAKDLGLLETKNLNKEQVIELWMQKFGPENAEKVGDIAWRRTALDPSYGRLLSIAWSLSPNDEIEPKSITSLHEDRMIRDFYEQLKDELGQRKPCFVAHRAPFDLKFLYRRSVINNIAMPYELPFRGRHGVGCDYYCTDQAWCEYGEHIKLDDLCKILGIPGKEGMDGSQVCDYWLAGRLQDIGAYNRADVRALRRVFLRQRGVHPGLAQLVKKYT